MGAGVERDPDHRRKPTEVREELQRGRWVRHLYQEGEWRKKNPYPTQGRTSRLPPVPSCSIPSATDGAAAGLRPPPNRSGTAPAARTGPKEG